jgi:hypothetical protein
VNQIVSPTEPTKPGPIKSAPPPVRTIALDLRARGRVLDEHTIDRVRGAEDNGYTAGVICAKVARYAERVHHPDRLTRPLVRKGSKGAGDFAPVAWDDALDLIAEKFLRIEQRSGAQAIWPYFYAGTMGLVMRDGITGTPPEIFRLLQTICNNPAWSGYAAAPADRQPRSARDDEIRSGGDLGTNAVNTQVNVMTRAVRARKERGARIVAVDIYMNGTMEQADLPVLVRPGTDGALACAVMHCLFRDGKADWIISSATPTRRAARGHLHARPAVGIRYHRLPGRDHREIRSLVGERKRAFFRLGYGFLAQRRRQHACRKLHRRSDRRLALRGRRRVPQQRRDLPLGQDHDRGAGRARPVGPPARSIARRRGVVRR